MTTQSSINILGLKGTVQNFYTSSAVSTDYGVLTLGSTTSSMPNLQILISQAINGDTSAQTQVNANLHALLSLITGVQPTATSSTPLISPPTVPANSFMTAEMAQNLQPLFQVLNALGVNTSTSPPLTITPNQFAAWGALGVPGSSDYNIAFDPTIILGSTFTANVQTAQRDAADVSIQALLETQYIEKANTMLSNQLTSLNNALTTTQGSLYTLANLQNAANQMVVNTKAPFSTFLNIYSSATFKDGNGNLVTGQYQTKASAYFAQPIVPTLTPSLFTLNPPITIPAGGAIAIPTTFNPAYIVQPVTLQPVLDNSYYQTATGVENDRVTDDGGNTLPAFPGNLQAGLQVLYPFSQNLFSLMQANGAASTPPFSPQSVWIETSTAPASGTPISTGFPQNYIYCNNSSGAVDPNFQKFIDTACISVTGNNSIIIIPGNTGANTGATVIGFASASDKAAFLTKYAAFTSITKINIAPGTFAYNSTTMSMLGVDWAGLTALSNAVQQLVSYRIALSTEIASLSAIYGTTVTVQSAGGTNLLSSLRQVYSDLTTTFKTLNGKEVSTGTPASSALAGFTQWIIDNYGSNTGTGATNAGIFQQNITFAVTAGQSLNDTQKEQVRNYLYLFQEFYTSASAMLTQLTTLLQKIADGVKG